MIDEKIISGKIKTPLGEMIACVSKDALLLLEFTDRKKYDEQLKSLKKYFRSDIINGSHELIDVVQNQMNEYFSGRRNDFNIALQTGGTEFQKTVWAALMNIPYGKTVSYSEIAGQIGKPKAVRAVANVAGANKIAIIIPCHRVIGANGTLTGYAGGLDKKKYLLDLENVVL